MEKNVLLIKEEMEAFIKENKSVLDDELRMNGKNVTRQTYVYDKNSYMFHIIVVDTPVIFGENDHRKTQFRQLYYDLRNKEIHIGLGNRELKPSMNSLDNIISKSTLKFIEVDENRGMYEFMVSCLAVLPNSYEIKHSVGRALIRLISEYHKLELIYKATPVLMQVINDSMQRTNSKYNFQYQGKDLIKRVLHFISRSEDKKKPHDIMEVKSKAIIRRAEKQLSEFAELVEEDETGSNYIQSTLWGMILYSNSENTNVYMELEDSLIKLQRENESREPYNLFNIYYYGLELLLRDIRELRGGYSNLDQLAEYLFYQCDQTQALIAKEATGLLRDYYRLVSHLPKYRKYPKYLKTAHDIASRNYRAIENDVLNDQMKFRYQEQASKLQMQLGDYVFIVPKKASELAEEGAMQGNCVAGYTKKVSQGTTSIVFMRHKDEPEQSLATVEVRNDTVVQALGAYNNRLPVDLIQPLAKWAWVVGLDMKVGDKKIVKGASRLIMKRSKFMDYREEPVLEKLVEETYALA